nr:MAG TPA: hypothetical protein [Caudoviricetes sp.]
MKDDWIRDEYLKAQPILLYVKRKNPKEYYPIFIKRKDEFNLTLKCDFFKIKIKDTHVTASEVALIVKPLLQPEHNISYTFSGYAVKAYGTDYYFIFVVRKSRTNKGYEYELGVIENNHTFSELSTRLVTKEELSLDKAFAELVKLNQLFGKEKVKILDFY